MPKVLTASEAAAMLHPVDVLGIPLGPGHPGEQLQAEAERWPLG